MEIRNVTTFVKIVECSSFTKAAESLGYSQAAVTAQIKAMESELGVPLFDRVGKRIYLTQAGRVFLPHALSMLRAEEEAVQSVRQTERLTGDLSICSASSYAQTVLPVILQKFLTIHGDVNITVKISDYLEDTTARVARGELDFLACIDEENAHPGFLTAAKRREKIVFVTYPDNPILKKGHVTLEDAVGSDFIIADRDISYCALLERRLRERGTDFDPVMEIGSVGAIINMMLNGYGTSFVPEFAVSDHIRKGELVRLDIADMGVELYSYFIYSKDRWINPVMKEFIRIAEECLQTADHDPVYIENDRLLIHHLEEQDLDSLRSMRCDELVYRYEPVFLAELQGSAETALETLRSMDLYKDRQCILGVYEKTDPAVLVGLAEFYDYKPSGKVISIGYRFRSEYWGRGIATSCVEALLEFIRNNTEVELVTAHVLPDNKASARCLLKNGFEYLLTKAEDWGFDSLCVADVYTLDC